MRMHHLGYLVKNIQNAELIFKSFGFQTEKAYRNEKRGIDACFMRQVSKENGILLELVSPYRDDSEVSSFIDKMGNTPYHICFISDDLVSDMQDLRKRGFIPTMAASEAPGLGGAACFMYSKDIGLIELVEVGEGDI